MAVPPRRPRSAAPLADIVGKTIGDAFAKQGFASVEIVTHWQEIVGDDLAKRSEPIKLIWPRRDDPASVGTLQVRVEGAYALEIQHLQPVIIERVNRYFGWRCVGRDQPRPTAGQHSRELLDHTVGPSGEWRRSQATSSAAREMIGMSMMSSVEKAKAPPDGGA